MARKADLVTSVSAGLIVGDHRERMLFTPLVVKERLEESE